MATPSPADLARDTLKLLATRRLAPTPANYQSVYEEVAGILPQVAFPTGPLRRIASVLPTQTPGQKTITQAFTAAVEAQDWIALQSAIVDFSQQPLGSTGLTGAITPASAQEEVIHTLPTGLAEQLARTLEATMAALGEEDHRMRELTDQLAHFLRTAPPPLTALEQMLNNYSYRLSFTADDQAQRHHSIQALLRMVCEHLTTVASHDSALQEHSQALTAAMQKPWTLAQLDHIQTHLKNLLMRHLELEGHREEAQEQLKDLLSQHAQQMVNLGQLSDSHAHKLQACASQIQSTHDLGDLAATLETVVHSGTALATENRMAQAQLADLRAQTTTQQQAIAQMSAHISQLAQSTRHDTHTGALNLDGLHETLSSETARLQRRRSQPSHTICLAALEIDDLEHMPASARSAALVHIARLARGNLRPQDALGRVTAQGFVIIFPGTEPAEAAQALERLQAQLTRSPLLHEDERLTLSFSAGIIALAPGTSAAESFTLVALAGEAALRAGPAHISVAAPT